MLYVKWVANTILTTGTHCTTPGLGRGGGAAVAAAAEENAKLRRCTALSAIAQLLQIAKTRQKIWSLDVISQVFPCKLLQIYITSVSGCLRFIFKTCRIVAGVSMICQFHEFLKFYFWRVFAIWFSCASPGKKSRKQ